MCSFNEVERCELAHTRCLVGFGEHDYSVVTVMVKVCVFDMIMTFKSHTVNSTHR